MSKVPLCTPGRDQAEDADDALNFALPERLTTEVSIVESHLVDSSNRTNASQH